MLKISIVTKAKVEAYLSSIGIDLGVELTNELINKSAGRLSSIQYDEDTLIFTAISAETDATFDSLNEEHQSVVVKTVSLLSQFYLSEVGQ